MTIPQDHLRLVCSKVRVSPYLILQVQFIVPKLMEQPAFFFQTFSEYRNKAIKYIVDFTTEDNFEITLSPWRRDNDSNSD